MNEVASEVATTAPPPGLYPQGGAAASSGRVEPLVRVLDNPILIGQARRRLRKRQVIPALLIPALIGLCGILFAAQGKNKPEEGWAILAYCSVFYIGLVLFLRGTIQVAGSLAEERRTGILDFHRATPTTPWTDALGYLLGGAAREYLTAAVGLPFLIIGALGAGSKIPLLGVVGLLGVLVLSTWLYHTVAMVVGLSVSNKRGVTGAAILAVVLLLWVGMPLYKLGFVTLAYLTPFPAAFRLLGLQEDKIGESVSFFGLMLHPLLFTLMVQGSVIGFLFLGATRKLHREGATTFSRPGACAFFALLMVLSFGGSWQWITGAGKTPTELHDAGGVAGLALFYLFPAVTLASALMLGLAPSYLEFVRALRRARRQGLPEARWLDDGAAAWPLAALFSGLVLVGLGVLVGGLGGRLPLRAILSRETGTCVLACLSFLSLVAGATEYVKLSQRSSARAWGALIVFVLMVLPWMLAGIAGTGGAGEQTVMYIGALSPTYGIGGSAIAMAGTWAQEESAKVPAGAVGMSLVVTMVVAGWFLYQTRALQGRLAEKMPLGAGRR